MRHFDDLFATTNGLRTEGHATCWPRPTVPEDRKEWLVRNSRTMPQGCRQVGSRRSRRKNRRSWRTA